jgi:hypothetical protein
MNANKYHAALTDALTDSLNASSSLGISAQAKGICISCNQHARVRCYSSAGRREFRFSGLCEVCFDNIEKEG